MSTQSIESRPGSGAMFDGIARRYDLLNRIMSLGIDARWRRRAVAALGLQPGQRALDLATGTADLAIEVAQMHDEVLVLGLDPSAGMLAVGQDKIDKHRLADRVSLVLGDAEELPFEAASFDAVSMAFGIRNVPDRARALREMVRVLRPGGRVAILELSEPGGGVMGFGAKIWVHHVVPLIGSLLSTSREYAYLQRSIQAFPPAAEFADTMREAGLEVQAVEPLTFGVAHLYLATRP